MTTRLTRLTTLVALTILTSLTGCDTSEVRDFGHERDSAAYRSAMDDYTAGRLDKAIEGFRKICCEDPANASARFQLACLLQDRGGDPFGAYCAFQEYLSQHPDSDKSSIARDRMKICERESAKALAEKHGLTSNVALTREIDELRVQLKDAEQRAAKSRDDVATAMQRIVHLRQENDRLKTALRGDDPPEEGNASRASGIKEARNLLDEDDTDRINSSADIAALRRELDEDANLPGPLDLASAGSRPKPAAESARPERPAEEPAHQKRPSSYVVQDGDTLYRIAMQFYGRRGAWKLIRDANKAIITTDGRIKTGMTIVLPDEK